ARGGRRRCPGHEAERLSRCGPCGAPRGRPGDPASPRDSTGAAALGDEDEEARRRDSGEGGPRAERRSGRERLPQVACEEARGKERRSGDRVVEAEGPSPSVGTCEVGDERALGSLGKRMEEPVPAE